MRVEKLMDFCCVEGLPKLLCVERNRSRHRRVFFEKGGIYRLFFWRQKFVQNGVRVQNWGGGGVGTKVNFRLLDLFAQNTTSGCLEES